MNKSTLERIHQKLTQALTLKKTERDWSIIQLSLNFWTQYLRIVRIWLSSKKIEILKNGRQLFGFLISLNPAREVSGIIGGMAMKEKFLHSPLIFWLNEFLGVLSQCGAERVYQIHNQNVSHKGKDEIDWENEIEDEEELIQRLKDTLGKSNFLIFKDLISKFKLTKYKKEYRYFF